MRVLSSMDFAMASMGVAKSAVGGTVRTLMPAVQARVIERLEMLLRGLEARHGARIALDYVQLCPLTSNHAAETEIAAAAARDVTGSIDTNTPPIMAGEDFSHMLVARPGAFIFIGNGDSAGLHNAAYDFNDAAIPAGVSYWVRLVETAQPA